MATEHHQHILLVEDEQHLAVGIEYNLQEEGYQVTTVGDGPAALEALEKADVDLVILDLMLPGMSGYAVCEKLRHSGSDVPVLMLSARTLSEDRTRGFDVGANQYLTKPFELDELLSRVKNLLTHQARRQAPPQPLGDVYQFGQARLDLKTLDVTVDGRTEQLTRLEWKLLRYFLEHPERVIPRDELLIEVWELPGYVSTRAPDQFIRRLRKLFEPDPSSPRYFLTVRDTGYRFVPQGKPPASEAAPPDSASRPA